MRKFSVLVPFELEQPDGTKGLRKSASYRLFGAEQPPAAWPHVDTRPAQAHNRGWRST